MRVMEDNNILAHFGTTSVMPSILARAWHRPLCMACSGMAMHTPLALLTPQHAG